MQNEQLLENKLAPGTFIDKGPAYFLKYVRSHSRSINEQIEKGSTLPDDLVACMRNSSCFRITVPKTAGGLEYTLEDTLRYVEELSACNGSLGWNFMIAIQSPSLLCHFSNEFFDNIYKTCPDLLLANSSAQIGDAVKTQGGYICTGKWTFASTSRFADYFLAQCRVAGNDAHEDPCIINIFLLKEQVKINQDWNAMGLRATESNSFETDHCFVPEERTFISYHAQPCLKQFPYSLPLRVHFACHMTAVALGIARAAFNEFRYASINPGTAKTSRRAHEIHQKTYDLGRTSVQFELVADAFYNAVKKLETIALNNTEDKAGAFMELFGTMVYITDQCQAVVETCFVNGGSSAISMTSIYQQSLRDIKTLSQHVNLSRGIYYAIGNLLSGIENNNSVL